MGQYVRKPIVVEAEQWFPGKRVPGVHGDQGQPMCPCHRVGGGHDRPHVMTAHTQIVHLEPGDWVLPEPNGRGHYPVKDDIFRAMYDPVPSSTVAALQACTVA